MKYKEWFNSQIHINDTIIDIGSKNGHMAYFLSEKCKFVFGIEIDELLVKKIYFIINVKI